MKDLNEVFSHIDPHFIPHPKTKGYKILCLLIDGKRHETRELEDWLRDNPCPGQKSTSIRSGLQALGNSNLGYWNIRNISERGAGIYQLDGRHLNGSALDDAGARADRQRLLLITSLAQARREAIRSDEALARYKAFQEKQTEDVDAEEKQTEDVDAD